MIVGGYSMLAFIYRLGAVIINELGIHINQPAFKTFW